MKELKVGDEIWAFLSARPVVIGPLKIREVDKEAGFYVCSDSDTTVRLPWTDIAHTRVQAAMMAKAYHECKFEIMGAALEAADEALTTFCDKEGID